MRRAGYLRGVRLGFLWERRMESLDDLMEAVELDSTQPYGRGGRDKAGF